MPKSLKKVITHLSYILFLSTALLYSFFYIALPHITRQGKIVQVPDLTGKSREELDEYMDKAHLRYTITDINCYCDKLPPFTVVQQFPAAHTFVKEYRKIYLALNAEHPPSVDMPNLVESSIKHAKLVLESKGLKIGRIKYVPDIAKEAVLEQWYNGKPIAAGKRINKGASIDIVAGNGLSKQIIEIPNVLGITLEEANLVLNQQNIRTDIVHRIKDKTEAVGTVVRQSPEAGKKVRVGTPITLWVSDL